MKLKMLKSIPGSLDGVFTKMFPADSIVEIDESIPRSLELGEVFLRESFAEIVTDDEAAKHSAKLAAMSPEALEEHVRSFDESARSADEKKKSARAKMTSKPVPPPPPAKPDQLVAGDVVALKGDAKSPLMTVEKVAADGAIECVWFEKDGEGKDTGPHRSVFKPSELVKASKEK